MPQFDHIHYSSQFFWLVICFTILYATVAAVILPRIKNIVDTRKNLIDADNDATHQLDKQIEELHSKTMHLRQESAHKYQTQIEEVSRHAMQQREKSLEELKDRVEEMTKKSRSDLKSFIENSREKSVAAVQNLVSAIKTKILN